MDDPIFIALQNFRKLIWILILGCAAFLLAASMLWFFSPRLYRLNRTHGVTCLMIGVIGAVLGWALGVSWDNNSMGFWVVYTVGHAILAATMVLTVAISFWSMWRR